MKEITGKDLFIFYGLLVVGITIIFFINTPDDDVGWSLILGFGIFVSAWIFFLIVYFNDRKHKRNSKLNQDGGKRD